MKAEVVPNKPRRYEYVKSFEENPSVVIGRLSSICKKKPEESYSSKDVRIFTFDCEDIIIDAVIADGGITIYVYTPGIKSIDNHAILSGGLLGVIASTAGAYYTDSTILGLILGSLVFVGCAWAIRRWLMRGSEVVELFERIKEL